ncbi:MAG: zinc metalloprotease HtpX [Methanosarcinaceae archaeon]|nr:zinc metalloprotease HtpX [Methanosarcinaceae archaeon]
MRLGNLLRTTFLMALLTVLLVAAGYLLGGNTGMLIAFVFAVIINFGTYFFSDKIALAQYNAQPVGVFSPLYKKVEYLSKRADLPTPGVYIVESSTPNAFATGRNPSNSAVAVTTGLLNLLNEDELEGVLAHELAHIKNRDVLISTIAATFAGVITMAANMGRWVLIFRNNDDSSDLLGQLIMIIVAPIAATLIQLAISRSREYDADATGANICKKPWALANALEKMSGVNKIKDPDPMFTESSAHMMIINPFKGSFINTLFSTHPSTEKRIEKLRNMRV